MTAARPLQVGVAELWRHPGTRRRVHERVPLEGLAISTSAVPEGGEIEVDVELEAIAGGVVAAGTVAAPWVGACRRCLEQVQGVAEVDVREVFEPAATEGETYPLGEDRVDLEPMVRDAVLLALPLAPLCSAGCRGPAPQAFPTGTAEADAPRPDPRWAALDELRFDDGAAGGADEA